MLLLKIIKDAINIYIVLNDIHFYNSDVDFIMIFVFERRMMQENEKYVMKIKVFSHETNNTNNQT